MKTFKLSFRVYMYVLLMGVAIIIFDLFTHGLMTIIFTIVFGIWAILGLIDTIKTKIIVEDDRLIYKQSFRTRYVFWKDVKALEYERGVKDYQHIIWVLTQKDISSFKSLKAICIRYTIKDYEELVKIIYEKSKDNPGFKAAPEVLNLLRLWENQKNSSC